MWIDTHTHFDASIFDNSRAGDWSKAQSLGVSTQFVMGITPSNFPIIEQLANTFSGTYFTLGIHPMYVMPLTLKSAISELKSAVKRNLDNPRFIGIGEIGLDGFVKNIDWNQQVDFFTAQLKLARDFSLPVFMHVRKSQDHVLKYCKRFNIQQGIAHAFNGSEQQAARYLDSGFKLGFGGAFTFERAKHLQRLVKNLPINAFVLETDSPDMSPSWVYQQPNYSYHLPRIAKQFTILREMEIIDLANHIHANTLAVIHQTLPRKTIT
ncbi:MAG: TatD family hydrolase [Ostreibacterium sp.]